MSWSEAEAEMISSEPQFNTFSHRGVSLGTISFPSPPSRFTGIAIETGKIQLVWNTLTTTCKRLGIAHVSSHCFRHTYRSWLDALGSPIGLQQRMMRHSSIITTANYGDTVPSDLRQAHEKLVQRALQHGNGTEGSTTH